LYYVGVRWRTQKKHKYLKETPEKYLYFKAPYSLSLVVTGLMNLQPTSANNPLPFTFTQTRTVQQTLHGHETCA